MADTTTPTTPITGSLLSQTGSFAPGASQAGTPAPLAVDSLGNPITPINLPTPPTTSTNGLGSLASVTSQANSIATPYTDSAKAIIDRINTLQGSDLNKTADTQTANTNAGVDTATKNVQDITNQINALNAESATSGLQIDQNNDGKGLVNAIGDRQKAEANRQLSIKSNMLGAQLSAAQGNLKLAQDQAQKVIDLHYQPIEQEITQKQQQLQLIAPFLTAEQKTVADAQTAKLTQQATDLADKKKQQQDVVNAAQTAGDANTAAAALKLDPNSSTFINDLASVQKGLVNPNATLDTQLKQLQIKEAAANIAKTQADTAKLNSQINSNGDTVSGLAQQLVGGQLAPSELSKRATGSGAYNDVLTAANKISLATTGKPFNIAQADRDFKFANQPATQNTLNYLGSLVGGNGQVGNLDALVNLSNTIDRSNFPALNDVAQWGKLESGDPTIAAYYATLTETADQVAKILQGGTSGGTSDAKLAQATALFQKGFSKDQVTAVANALKPLLQNRAKSMIGDNPYLSDYADQFGTNLPSSTDLLNAPIPGGSASSTPTSGYTPNFWNTTGIIK